MRRHRRHAATATSPPRTSSSSSSCSPTSRSWPSSSAASSARSSRSPRSSSRATAAESPRRSARRSRWHERAHHARHLAQDRARAAARAPRADAARDARLPAGGRRSTPRCTRPSSSRRATAPSCRSSSATPCSPRAACSAMLAQRAHVRPTELAESIYSPRNCDAARQLFRVCSGLESMIVGEAEIQGQVKRAYEEALAAGTTGPLTNRLFTAALQTGKRVRSETSIGLGRASISSVAVELAMDVLGDKPDPHVVIIGAGETSELTARALAARGVRTIFVANRHADRARALAERFNGGVVALDELPGAARARGRRRRVDRVAAPDPRRGGARARHARPRRPAAAARRHRRAARHRRRLRRPAGRDALRHGRPAGARRAHDLDPRGRGAARRGDRRGGDRALRRVARVARRAADDPRAARVRRRDRRAGAGRERRPLGDDVRARPARASRPSRARS